MFKSNFLITAVLAMAVFFSACEKENNEITPTQDDEKKDENPDTSATPPNILLIIADDMGIEATPNYSIGAVKPSMPHLDSLAQQGITFDNVWSYPTCAPTRASILTGKYGYRTGVLNAESLSELSSSEKSIQRYIDENTNNGYDNAVFGKWHLSKRNADGPNQLGVSHFAGILAGGVNDYNNWTMVENGISTEENSYITTKLTDLAIDWIGKQDKPWFCWMAYTAAHTPFHTPPNHMHNQGNLPAYQDGVTAPQPYFMAMIESLDFEIGRLLDNLPADEKENTIIIFIGDNGTDTNVIQQPYKARKSSKGKLYQGGVHIPMIVSGKGVTRLNEREGSLISSVDLFATIADLAGTNTTSYNDSKSFKPLLSQSGSGARTYNYVESSTDVVDRSGYAIRNEKYKLFVFDNGTEELYDLVNDPYESTNLNDGNLTNEENSAIQALKAEASQIRQ